MFWDLLVDPGEYQMVSLLAEEIKVFYGRAGTGIHQLGFKGRLRT